MLRNIHLTVIYVLFIILFIFPPAVKDVNVLLERERTESNSSPSRDDDSTLLNVATHSSILDENTKSDSGLPEVSGETEPLFDLFHFSLLFTLTHQPRYRQWTCTVWSLLVIAFIPVCLLPGEE